MALFFNAERPLRIGHLRRAQRWFDEREVECRIDNADDVADDVADNVADDVAVLTVAHAIQPLLDGQQVDAWELVEQVGTDGQGTGPAVDALALAEALGVGVVRVGEGAAAIVLGLDGRLSITAD